MAHAGEQPRQAVKVTRGLRRRAYGALVLVVLVCLGSASALIYLTADQELSKNYFSAHRELGLIWKGLLPAVFFITGGFALVAVALCALVIRGVSRSVERSGRELMGVLDDLGRGRLRVPPEDRPVGHLEPAVKAAAESINALQGRLQEVKTVSAELQRVVMRLNYLASEEGKVTLAELKSISANLSTLGRELTNSLKWFEN